MTTKAQRADAEHMALVASIRDGSACGLSLDAAGGAFTGYAVWKHGVVREHGTWVAGVNAPKKERLRIAREGLCRIIGIYQPVLIVAESACPTGRGGFYSAYAQGMVKGVLVDWCENIKGIPFPCDTDLPWVKALAPQAVKKAFTGSGGSLVGKGPVQAQAKILVGLGLDDAIDEHAADAIAVGYAAGFSVRVLEMLFQPAKAGKKGKVKG